MNTSNKNITFKGNPIKVFGRELAIGDTLPDFKLTAQDMSDLTKANFAGKVLIVSSVPSLDTPVCAVQTKKFNEEVDKLGPNVAVLTVSMDLPMAQKRFCGAENVSNVTTGSDFKYRSFGEDFGTYLPDLGLLARAVFIADRSGTIQHVEYVNEIAQEPDYEPALAKARELAA